MRVHRSGRSRAFGDAGETGEGEGGCSPGIVTVSNRRSIKGIRPSAGVAVFNGGDTVESVIREILDDTARVLGIAGQSRVAPAAGKSGERSIGVGQIGRASCRERGEMWG